MSSSAETIDEMAKAQLRAQRKFINPNLVSLKFMLFFFFGGIGCLVPFLPLHMDTVGLSKAESRTISMLAPLVALLGPLIAGPLADRIAASRLRKLHRQNQRSVSSQNLANGNGVAGTKTESNGAATTTTASSSDCAGTDKKPLHKKQQLQKNGHMLGHYKECEGEGRYLRVMIATCCLFSALFYSLLVLVPQVHRIDRPNELGPSVKLACDEHGGFVHQERCENMFGCHRWADEDSVGLLQLKGCRYACYPSDVRRIRGKYPPTQAGSSSTYALNARPGVEVLEDAAMLDSPASGSRDNNRPKIGLMPLQDTVGYTELSTMMDTRESRSKQPRASEWQLLKKSAAPHVCYEDATRDGRGKICHVFTDIDESELPGHGVLAINVSLRQAVNPEANDEWCSYPIAQPFNCRIPGELADKYRSSSGNVSCLVECRIEQPYDDDLLDRSVLAESQCRQVMGNEQLTFWMYLAIRCLADIFPTAALALIDAAIVIATRETSSGRGDVGRQLAFGCLGLSAFGALAGFGARELREVLGTGVQYGPSLALAVHAVLMLLAASCALTAERMPLGPPEWWWHTRSGMLAVPLSSVRRYGAESVALFLLLCVLGSFASAIDAYLPLHLVHLKADEFEIGVALTIGALPAVLFLWKSEHFVDYCGHSNLLITAFIMYILRFTGLSLVPDVWWALISEALELFTLEIMWVTAVLYFRHLIPRQMTATGQALPVMAHFCIGRAIGALIGACTDKISWADEIEAMRFIYQCMAIAAAIIAILYFVFYHCILKPRCHAQTVQSIGPKQPPTVAQAMNGNGNYTPLKVYHNGLGRKGQFRY
ncbi:hypothetical protein QAD02_014777 [Eretmocerus hayati]|uniref:Uncharacterized protein n=1 Tax=Eretmocerus hayati TaxID=131215 RepID=A0ACC2PB55_9HYME|nr:hypothetical protein QAD02_014777 [Eretmocerus hayati]